MDRGITIPVQRFLPFHPARLTKPKRVIKAAYGIQAVPREVVHQILDDLTTFQVLQLVACQQDSTYFDLCLLVHPHLQHLFTTHGQTLYTAQNALADVRDLFIMSHELRLSLNLELAPKESPITHNVRFFSSRGMKIAKEHLSIHLRKDIIKILKLPEHIRAFLYRYTKDDTFEELNWTRYWAAPSNWELNNIRLKVLDAQQKLNNAQSIQLVKMAEVLEEFPTLLKRATDPAQKPRPNMEHIASLFRVHAERVQHNQLLDHTKWNNAGTPYMFHLFPLVPFDSCLRLFVRTLRDNPLTKPLRIDSSTWTEYPESIAKDIQTAIDGLTYVFTIPKSDSRNQQPPKVLRTKFTPYSAPPFRRPTFITSHDSSIPLTLPPAIVPGVAQYEHCEPLSHNAAHLSPSDEETKPSQLIWPISFAQTCFQDDCWDPCHEHPVFTSPPCGHLGVLAAIERSSYGEQELVPSYSMKELEWLQAFLRVVTYMKGTESEQVNGLKAVSEKSKIAIGSEGDWSWESMSQARVLLDSSC